jgi:hypothetical protein
MSSASFLARFGAYLSSRSRDDGVGYAEQDQLRGKEYELDESSDKAASPDDGQVDRVQRFDEREGT